MRLKLPLSALCGLVATVAMMLVADGQAQEISVTKQLGALASTVSQLSTSTALAQSTAQIDRAVLIKSLYYFVNGGPNGSWPSGEVSAMTGHNAPSDRLKDGFLGLVNELVGPKGDVIKFLEGKGYTTCASLPDAETSFEVTDKHEGALKVTVSSSTRDIPAGLANTGKFEKRIHIAKTDGTALAALHLHCSTKNVTMLVRLDTALMTDTETELVEIISDGSEDGGAVHMEFISQNANAGGQDLALKFKSDDGDTYSIYIAFTSGKEDVNGNGPAHIIAGVAGKKSDKKATLHVMGGNTDITAGSNSNDVLGLPFNATQTVTDMAAGNKFCMSTETAADTTGCPTLAAPGTPAISGLAAWTMKGIYDVRQGTTNVPAISTY